MWPRKYGWLNFAILECSLNVWIVNKIVFAAPELREKCAAKSEVFTSLPQITSHKPLLAEFSNITIFYIRQYSWIKSCKRNQWNLPNILSYILGIFKDIFKDALVPLIKTISELISPFQIKLHKIIWIRHPFCIKTAHHKQPALNKTKGRPRSSIRRVSGRRAVRMASTVRLFQPPATGIVCAHSGEYPIRAFWQDKFSSVNSADLRELAPLVGRGQVQRDKIRLARVLASQIVFKQRRNERHNLRPGTWGSFLPPRVFHW